MVRKSAVLMTAALLVCALIFNASCAAKQKVKSEPGEVAGKTAGQMEEAEIRMEMQRARDAFVDEDINFDFDKALLSLEARRILDRKAVWLNNNPEVVVTIEGHCDERGTSEYNVALGERRAFSAKDYLEGLGIDSGRLMTVTYGEEQPLDPGHDEDAWAKNRRAHFVIH
jgi:peptidoglycan-associated lipoprotein